MIVLLQKKLIKAYLGYTPKRHYLEQAAIGINPKHLYFRRGKLVPMKTGIILKPKCSNCQKIQNTFLRRQKFWICVIRICLEFRNSIFGFNLNTFLQESKFKINILILRRKTHITTVRLVSYNYFVLRKTVENLAPQKQKIKPSLLYLYQNRRLHFKQNLPFYWP